MLDHLELALISKQIYFRKEGKIVGWKRLEYFSDNEGLAAGVYAKNNITVIAFRGTDTGNLRNFIKNLITGIRILFAKSINTIESAKGFVKKVDEQRDFFTKLFEFLCNFKCNQLYLTGHSMGGTIAGIVGYEMIKAGKNYYVVTFENPGFSYYLSAEEKKSLTSSLQERFITYLADPNPINTRHAHIGIIRRVRLKAYKNDFFSKVRHHSSFYLDCAVNDILRIILLLLFLEVISLVLVGRELGLTDIVYTLSSLSKLFGQDVITLSTDEGNPITMFYFFLQFVAYTISYKMIKEVLDGTFKQHALDGIIQALTKTDCNASLVEMESWPNFKQYLLTQSKNYLAWLNPIQQRSMLSTDIVRPDKIYESEVKSFFGYKEKPSVSRS